MSAVAFEWVRSPTTSDRWILWLTVNGERAALYALERDDALAVFRALETGDYEYFGQVPSV